MTGKKKGKGLIGNIGRNEIKAMLLEATKPQRIAAAGIALREMIDAELDELVSAEKAQRVSDALTKAIHALLD